MEYLEIIVISMKYTKLRMNKDVFQYKITIFFIRKIIPTIEGVSLLISSNSKIGLV